MHTNCVQYGEKIMGDTTSDRKRAAMEKFSQEGISMQRWAKKHGVSRSLVNAVINGKCQARINKGHKISVLLGLKAGMIENESSN